ncbi:MAG TPA: cytochrome c [Bryobacteraceae bacterium]|nr:cytochrome c [Bryobacteraceae bacterium]
MSPKPIDRNCEPLSASGTNNIMMRNTLGYATGIALCFTLTLGMAASQKNGAAAKGDAAKGKETFEACAVCHNVDSPEKKMGPSLQGLFKRKTLTSGRPVTDANVMSQINKGGNGMPAFGDQLSADDKANLLAYLHTL